jgi:hypothetical protein
MPLGQPTSKSLKFKEEDGAARGIRTPDPLITNEVLYQLSYCGIATLRSERPPSYPLPRRLAREGKGGMTYQTEKTLRRADACSSGLGTSGGVTGKTTGSG